MSKLHNNSLLLLVFLVIWSFKIVLILINRTITQNGRADRRLVRVKKEVLSYRAEKKNSIQNKWMNETMNEWMNEWMNRSQSCNDVALSRTNHVSTAAVTLIRILPTLSYKYGYRNFRRVRRYFLHLLPRVCPMRQSALSMDFAKNCPTFLMSRLIQPSILRSSILYYQIFGCTHAYNKLKVFQESLLNVSI